MFHKSHFENNPVVYISTLDYDGALALKEYLNDLTHYNGKLHKKYMEEAQFYKKLVVWVLGNLKEGTYLKMKGCRDGNGIRIFMNFTGDKLLAYDELDHDKPKLVCRQVLISRWDKKQKESLGQITEHYIDKITQIKINGVWTPIRSIVK